MMLVDSNVWIFAAKEGAPEREVALNKLSTLLPRNEVAINAIIVSEVYHKIATMHGVGEGKRKTEVILSDPLVTWLEFKRETALGAVELAEKAGMRINDALIAQQALEAKATILSDDVKDFRKVKGLRVTALR